MIAISWDVYFLHAKTAYACPLRCFVIVILTSYDFCFKCGFTYIMRMLTLPVSVS